MPSHVGTEKLQFLTKLALDKGAAEAKIIPASKIVVEDRVVLKCKVGCNHYGKTLACPPYTPNAEEFRKIVNEYSYAMFIKFKSTAEAEPEVLKKLTWLKPTPLSPKKLRRKRRSFGQTGKMTNEKCSNQLLIWKRQR